jgi:hypothetical protein
MSPAISHRDLLRNPKLLLQRKQADDDDLYRRLDEQLENDECKNFIVV